MEKIVEDIYTLSPAQSGILYHSTTSDLPGLYVTQIDSLFEGELDVFAFRGALNSVVQKNAVLRTGFFWEEVEHPVQVVFRKASVPFIFEDIKELPQEEKDVYLEIFLANDRKTPFDMASPPLMRVGLFCLEPDKYSFVLAVHHILLDGWSLAIIWEQLWKEYICIRSGEVSNSESPQYRDYIAWCTTRDHEKAKQFWGHLLKDFDYQSMIAPVKGVSSKNASSYTEIEFVLSDHAAELLDKISKEKRVTLNTLIQGVWGLLLGRFTGTNDVTFGVTVSGRNTDFPGVESVVGLLLNTLPFRCNINSADKFVDYLRRVQLAQQSIEEFSYTPLYKIHEWNSIPSGGTVFDTIYVFENYPAGNGGNNSIVPHISHVGSVEQTNYPLTVTIVPDKVFKVKLAYYDELIEHDTVGELSKRFKYLLESVSSFVNKSIGDIKLICADELDDWKLLCSGPVKSSSSCVHSMFEEQVARTPQSTAIICDTEIISYQELNKRANQFAVHLRQVGAVNTTVAIYMDKNINIVIAMLGVMKAGGTFLTLDPKYPRERIATMVDDSRAQMIVTESKYFTSLKGYSNRAILNINDIQLEQYSTHDQRQFENASAAYVFYTSGSTGRPKGVLTSHESVCNYLSFLRDTYKISPMDTVLQLPSMSFDACIRDVIGPLVSGAKVIMTSSQRDVTSLIDIIIKHNATALLSIVPTILKALAEKSIQVGKQMDSVRLVLVSGEPLFWSDMETIRSAFDYRMRLYNQYGPTECTMTSTFYEVPRNLSGQGIMPLGRPINNCFVYVLDSDMNPLPSGFVGDIYIGGRGVSTYLNHDLSDKFIEDLFSEGSKQKLYRTGDRGKYLLDGNLHYIGRVDDQVKIRGAKIQLTEIETALMELSSVNSASVVVHEDQRNGLHLVAYVVPDVEFDWNKCRFELSTKIPSYMIPSNCVMVDSLPLNPNGKVDKRKLRNERPGAVLTKEHLSPRNSLELRVTRIWEEILNVNEVGILDDFFDLGGHSLKVLEFASRFMAEFNQKLPMSVFFNDPTVSGVCNYVGSNSIDAEDSILVQLRNSKVSNPPLFLIHPAAGQVLCYLPLIKRLSIDIPIVGIQSVGYASSDEPLQSMESMVNTYIGMIREYQPRGPYTIAGWSMGGKIAFELTKRLEANGEQVELLILFDSRPDAVPMNRQSDLLRSLKQGLTHVIHANELAAFTEHETVMAVFEQAKLKGDIPQTESFDEYFRKYSVFKLNSSVSAKHQAEGKIRAKIHFFRCTKQDKDTVLELLDRYAWDGFTEGEVFVTDVPSTHETLMHIDNVGTLCNELIPLLNVSSGGI